MKTVRAGASRPTLAAYAAGTKSPNLATAERIIQAAGFDLEIVPVLFSERRPLATATPSTSPPCCPGRPSTVL
jgi:hypothetical protein